MGKGKVCVQVKTVGRERSGGTRDFWEKMISGWWGRRAESGRLLRFLAWASVRRECFQSVTSWEESYLDQQFSKCGPQPPQEGPWGPIIFIIIIRGYLAFLLSFSHTCAVGCSRGYKTWMISRQIERGSRYKNPTTSY